jgi:hypothetical protein
MKFFPLEGQGRRFPEGENKTLASIILILKKIKLKKLDYFTAN